MIKNKFKIKVFDEFNKPIFKSWVDDKEIEEAFKTIKKKIR